MNGSRGEVEQITVGGGLSPGVVAAHELKSPLALLRQLALSLENSALSEAQKSEIIQHMKLVTERGLRLTSNITKATRLEDALFELEPLNPHQLCEDIVYELSPLYQACGRTIELTQRKRAPLALGNKDLLRRIMLNFADNALHYGDEQTTVKLSVQSLGHGDMIRLGVRDAGPALPANLWNNIESQLLRPQQVSARPESSGLGLTIAKSFAEATNCVVGAIRHHDGATFFVDVHASKQLSLL